MSNLNGRLSKLEKVTTPPTAPAQAYLAADGSLGLYQNGRLVKDMGATINKIYGTNIPPAPQTPGPAGPETLHELITRVCSR